MSPAAVVAAARVLDAGSAWFDGAGHPPEGAVCGVFGRAAYLRFGRQILAVCGPDVASGPLHLRLDPLPLLALGQAARLYGGRLEVGSLSVTAGSARHWMPRPVEGESLRSGGATIRALDPGWPEAAGTGLAPDDVEPARKLAAQGDLVGLARRLGGRGPGLTPAGDDLLAGVLVVHAALHPGAAALRRRAAAAAPTTDVAAAFLRWAAAGQCIRPVHDLLEAVAGGHPTSVAAACVRLRGIGASSGAALLLGVASALCIEREH